MTSEKKLIGSFLLLFIAISSSVFAQPFEKPLSEQEIKKWFVASIETQNMLWTYQENASDYEDAPLAYGNAKKEWLRNNGWDPSHFEKLTERIHGVYNSIQDQKDINEERAELKSQLDEIENNQYISSEQKKEIRKGLLQTIDERQKVVNYFKPDWPAFKPYLVEYEQLNDWMSKNIENPPSID